MPTIAAIATAPGSGGIGIVRLSGPESKAILARLFSPARPGFTTFAPYRLHHGLIRDQDGLPLDDCLAVFMPGPNSYTGEDMAEIQCHGSPLILQTLLTACMRCGARQARPGEYSQRAFLNGRMDLTQAEAVAELVAAPNREAARYCLERLCGQLAERVSVFREKLDWLRAEACVAIDFPDDEIDAPGREDFAARLAEIGGEIDILLRNAARSAAFQTARRVSMAGPVNAGKSSLLNALAGRERALVSPEPGTTRDYIEEQLEFGGLTVRLTDTAGLRDSSQTGNMEALGIANAMRLFGEADLLWLVLDGSEDPCAHAEELRKIRHLTAERNIPLLLVLNKADLFDEIKLPPQFADCPSCAVSALTGAGLDELCSLSADLLLAGENRESVGLAPNLRQRDCLERARGELAAMAEELMEGQMFDLCLTRLDSASAALDEIIGLAPHDELLDKIFSNFCIGK